MIKIQTFGWINIIQNELINTYIYDFFFFAKSQLSKVCLCPDPRTQQQRCQYQQDRGGLTAGPVYVRLVALVPGAVAEEHLHLHLDKAGECQVCYERIR